MEQKFSNNSIDLQVLREFREREDEEMVYYKGNLINPTKQRAFVTKDSLYYVMHDISILTGSASY